MRRQRRSSPQIKLGRSEFQKQAIHARIRPVPELASSCTASAPAHNQRMPLHHTAVLALVLCISCEPTIKTSTDRAGAAAAHAEQSATQAQQVADQAFKASVRALIVADQAESDSRRANDAVSRLEAPSIVHGDLLVEPSGGSPVRWCLMGPPIEQGSPMGSQSIDFHAPRSRFWVGDIFDSKSECHDALRKFHRQFVRFGGKNLPFRAFCAACANEADDDED